MANLKELLAQRDALEKQIAQAREQEAAQAIAQVRTLVAEFGFTERDVFGTGRSASKYRRTAKVAAKYRDPVTGATWSGRGKSPKWLQGKDRAKFLIT